VNPAKYKRPTWAYLVEEALRTADDFVSVSALRNTTGASANQLSATLHHLQKCKTVDAVVAQDSLYWFYTGDDTRCRHVEERAVEDKPRRQRKAPSTSAGSK
jgi:hypothetical protein